MRKNWEIDNGDERVGKENVYEKGMDREWEVREWKCETLGMKEDGNEREC